MTVKKIIHACCPTKLRQVLVKIEASDIGFRLAKGTFWTIVGTLISRSLMLCATVVVARLLGKTIYGELGMIQSTVGMFGVFAGFGLGLTATKHVAEFRQSNPRLAGHIIGLSNLVAILCAGLMTLGLFALAPWLALHMLNAPHLVGALRIGALIPFISALNGAQTGVLAGFEAFRTIAWVNLVVGLFSFPLLITGTYFAGLTGAVWALVINLGINWLYNHIAMRKEARRCGVPICLRFHGQEWSILWKFSLPAVLSASMTAPVIWCCNAMLVNQPRGYEEMGVFNAANQWFYVLLFLPEMLGRVILPILSELFGQGKARQSLKTLLLAMNINLLIIVPFAIIASIASPYIMSLYGADFSDGWPTLVVVLLTSVFFAVQSPIGHVIAASNRMWVSFAMNAGWALVFTVSTVLLIGYGALGLATARGIAYFVHFFWGCVFVIYLLKIKKTHVCPKKY